MPSDRTSRSESATSGEFAFLERLATRLGGREAGGEVHIGDDAAVLSPPHGHLLFATDAVVEGVHFELELSSPADIGWKALAVNVSDIAAMGGRPLHAVAAVAARPGLDLDALLDGLAEAAEQYGVAFVGGDLSAARQLVVSVAIVGETDGLAAVLRRGARPGDELWCSGPLGASAAGLRRLRAGDCAGPLVEAYKRPTAHPTEGRLAAAIGARAMIDVSDGLSRDLAHIGEASAVGIALDTVPVAAGATEEEALGGGEDYELAFAVPPDTDVEEEFVRAGLRAPIRIGCCLEDPSVRTLRGVPLPLTGWEHDLGG